ncbi:MAG: formate dehydrogenase accessory sulfurtransferase FdhD [Gemmatimonas sp.]
MPLADWESSISLATRTCWFDGRHAADGSRDVPVEMAINVLFGVQPYAVMMTTPQDLEDFAYGFSITEGVIDRASDIDRVHVRAQRNGVELLVSLAAGVEPRIRARNTAGRTGCGLCGIDQLDALPMATVRPHTRAPVELSAVRRALDALEQQQALNRLTHAVHAAAWSTATGEIVALREDVGRHNALDKLIGALVRANHQPDDGFLLITSRCSFEMVEKAAVYGASTIVAISAPTSLAVERATVHGMTLLAIARRDNTLAFHGAEFVHAGSVATGAAGENTR